MNVITLSGYSATADVKRLELGTFDSFGIEQLKVIKGDGWEDLNVIATFNPPNKKPVQVVVDSVTDIFDVPKEATEKLYGVGTIVFVGLADGVQRISADIEYIVKKHSNASGTEPAKPTPSVVQQILTEAQNANKTSADAKKLATDAKDIAQSVRNDADEGKFNGAKGEKGETGTTPQLKISEDNLWHVSYDNGETWVSLGVKATGDTGAAGKDGVNGLTPHIGENGNWWVGDTDTGVLAKGLKGDTGDKGADGVSPTATVTQTDNGAEFTVTDVNGTTTATIKNGTNGKDGAPGANGVSPTVQVETIDGGHRVTFTDASDSHVVDVLDGKPGKDAVVDATLTQDGQAADAKVTGEKISQLQKRQNVLVGSETGNPVSCDDAFAAPLCGLNVYGKSTQDGTPTLDAPVPIVSAGDGGTIAVKMTGKNLFHEQGFQQFFINNSADVVGTAPGNVSSILQVATGAKYYVTRNKVGTKFRVAVVNELPVAGVTVRPSSAINGDSKRQVEISATSKYMIIQCEDEAAFDELMVSLDSSTAYSPYREQLLTMSTPNGLPGIPVTSGGNYTDSTGQQWICDEIDLERGVMVQRVYKVEVDGETTKFVQTGDYANISTRGLPIALYAAGQRIFAISTFTKLNWFYNTVNGQFLYLIAPEMSGKINESCKKQLGKIYYVLATPIETPLTPAEIAAYKAITAYAPDTVAQASDGAGIKLDYQRDVNLVVKNLEDAIASMTTT